MISKTAAALGISGFQIRGTHISFSATIAAATPNGSTFNCADTFHNGQPSKTLTGDVFCLGGTFNAAAALFVSAVQ